MAKKKKKKAKSTAVLKNSNYDVKGAGNNRMVTSAMKAKNKAEESSSRKAISNARKMAKIEAYAKEHGITVTQAMVHFME